MAVAQLLGSECGVVLTVSVILHAGGAVVAGEGGGAGGQGGTERGSEEDRLVGAPAVPGVDVPEGAHFIISLTLTLTVTLTNHNSHPDPNPNANLILSLTLACCLQHSRRHSLIARPELGTSVKYQP